MKRHYLFPGIIALFLISTTQPSCAQTRTSARTVSYKKDSDYNPDKMSKDILYYINEHRVSLGLSELMVNDAATAQATKHSWDMANGVVSFGHDGFEERMTVIISKVGTLRESAENVASGQMSAKEVVDGWLNSPGHKRNIEGNFKYTGIGIAQASDGHLYFTQIFYRQ